MESFDASNEVHVKWLKKFVEADTDKKIDILKENPMKQDFKYIDVAYILFGLCAKYTQAVFKKSAVLLE